jgi:hypothetical protein
VGTFISPGSTLLHGKIRFSLCGTGISNVAQAQCLIGLVASVTLNLQRLFEHLQRFVGCPRPCKGRPTIPLFWRQSSRIFRASL